MLNKEIKNNIRKEFTYYNNKGKLNGYLLTEQQFEKIFKVMEFQQLRFEMLLARVIDDLYLEHKSNFCGGRPHKLGWFKEQIKLNVHKKIND